MIRRLLRALGPMFRPVHELDRNFHEPPSRPDAAVATADPPAEEADRADLGVQPPTWMV